MRHGGDGLRFSSRNGLPRSGRPPSRRLTQGNAPRSQLMGRRFAAAMTPRTTSAPSTRCRCGRASAASCSRRSPPPRNRMNSPHGLATTETRFFIGSLGLGVKQFAKAVRNHWGIENTCHWSLDVTYREDDSRLRDAHARENFAWLNRFTLSLLKQHPGKGSLAVKRRSCGWQPRFRPEVLAGQRTFLPLALAGSPLIPVTK